MRVLVDAGGAGGGTGCGGVPGVACGCRGAARVPGQGDPAPRSAAERCLLPHLVMGADSGGSGRQGGELAVRTLSGEGCFAAGDSSAHPQGRASEESPPKAAPVLHRSDGFEPIRWALACCQPSHLLPGKTPACPCSDAAPSHIPVPPVPHIPYAQLRGWGSWTRWCCSMAGCCSSRQDTPRTRCRAGEEAWAGALQAGRANVVHPR